MNKSLIKLFIRECGFKNHDLNLCKDVINSNYKYYCYHRDQCWLDNDNIDINHDIKNNKDNNFDNDDYDHPMNYNNNLFLNSTSSDYSSSMNNNDTNDIESDIYSIFQNRPTSNSSINNSNNNINNNSTSSNFYRIDPEIRYPVLNRGVTLPEVLNYNFYRSFSWMELSSLAECAALGFNESRHSYHKVSKLDR
jgi:hypothetical protein